MTLEMLRNYLSDKVEGSFFFFTVIYNLFLTHFSVLKVYNMLVQGSATLNTNADTFIILQPIKSCKHFSTLLMTQLLTLYCCLTYCTTVQNNKKKMPVSTYNSNRTSVFTAITYGDLKSVSDYVDLLLASKPNI